MSYIKRCQKRDNVVAMKCNHKRSYSEALNKKWEQQKKEYDEWFNSLSKEEQEAELKRKEQSLKDTFNLLSIHHALDINKYY